VELSKPWQPPFRFRDSDIVPVPVAFEEKALREKLRAEGGKLDPLSKTWFVPYRYVHGTNLEGRVPENFITAKKREVNRPK